jgi:hypothetical protein
MSAADDGLGFAPEHDAPIPYMQRTRDYYLASATAIPIAGHIAHRRAEFDRQKELAHEKPQAAE